MKKFFAWIFLFSAVAFADDVIQFATDPYELGEIPQGETRHVKLGGANVSNRPIQIETVLCQGVGCSNFQYTKEAKPREPVNVEFDFSTANLEGKMANMVVIVDSDGKPHPITLQGTVVAPFIFSEKMFDAGYYSSGEKREWTFYVWSADQKTRPDLTLPQEFTKEFSVQIKNVSLNVKNFDAIQEGGKIPGQKITLKTAGLFRDPKMKQKSLSKIVSFSSKLHPKATPEVLIIGYWK
ncbi:MAG: DUF1573 domain-containing protein [Hallerella porci]|uniref:Uncharacterized protein DUF1573 n=1 Tax=Hallerella porci TaxID=1945871 RepID=A0ABX5LQ64_9BACT|nr:MULTISPECIES: DUF1573 domain-containing protein [Hallerella]MCI5600770.1 DUF1573 domain-containing protein [Hallerella sp.]MDY3920912.1 DUF1573 domain-containing protein [Hallerella porci]PWL04112.1 uncharacterized protein DUF1573 [Hallerella porci]